jgi:hypothetical protein
MEIIGQCALRHLCVNIWHWESYYLKITSFVNIPLRSCMNFLPHK